MDKVEGKFVLVERNEEGHFQCVAATDDEELAGTLAQVHKTARLYEVRKNATETR